MKTNFCQLQLTCANKEEAYKIANTLLVKHLVACVKQIPITSDFHWQGKIDKAAEILLLMETKVDLFEQIEAEVAKLHSYKTFVLAAVPIVKLSKNAEGWIEGEVKNAR